MTEIRPLVLAPKWFKLCQNKIAVYRQTLENHRRTLRLIGDVNFKQDFGRELNCIDAKIDAVSALIRHSGFSDQTYLKKLSKEAADDLAFVREAMAEAHAAAEKALNAIQPIACPPSVKKVEPRFLVATPSRDDFPGICQVKLALLNRLLLGIAGYVRGHGDEAINDLGLIAYSKQGRGIDRSVKSVADLSSSVSAMTESLASISTAALSRGLDFMLNSLKDSQWLWLQIFTSAGFAVVCQPDKIESHHDVIFPLVKEINDLLASVKEFGLTRQGSIEDLGLRIASTKRKDAIHSDLLSLQVEIGELNRKIADKGRQLRWDSLKNSLENLRDKLRLPVPPPPKQPAPPPPPPAVEPDQPPFPVPQDITVSPSGARPVVNYNEFPNIQARRSINQDFRDWIEALDQGQLRALEFVLGLEDGRIFNKLGARDSLKEDTGEGTLLAATLTGIDALSTTAGISNYREAIISKLQEMADPNNVPAGYAWEIIVLGAIAQNASRDGKLTAIEKDLNGVVVDGYCNSSQTVIEAKFCGLKGGFTLATIERSERFQRQAESFAALATNGQSGKIRGIEYHIRADEIGEDVIEFLEKTFAKKVPFKVFRYDSISDLEPELEWKSDEIVDEEGEIKEKPPKKKKSSFDATAWTWALSKYLTRKDFKISFKGGARNLKSVIRRVHTVEILSGLQTDLAAKKEKVCSDDQAKIEELKQTINSFSTALRRDTVGISTLNSFSAVLRQARQWLSK